MRKLPFADASFDAVVASSSIHNIYSVEGRRQAILEIVRVLKPGGKVALMDIRHVREYAAGLLGAGMNDVKVSGLSFWIFPPVRTVTESVSPSWEPDSGTNSGCVGKQAPARRTSCVSKSSAATSP